MKKLTVVMTEAQRSLIAWDYRGKETILCATGGLSESADEVRVLVRELLTPREGDYSEQEACAASLRGQFMFDAYEKAYEQGLPVFISSHAHPGEAFSSAKDEKNTKAHLNVASDFGIRVYVPIITGSDGIAAYAYRLVDGHWQRGNIGHIVVYKPDGIDIVVPNNSETPAEIAIDCELHNRTLQIGGGIEAALAKIKGLALCVIGVGGVGNALIHLYKHLGPEHLVLIDPDCLEKSNGNRYLGYHEGDEGKPKVEVAKRELLAFNPSMRIETYQERFPSESTVNALKRCRLAVAAPDRHWVRLQVSQYCAKHCIPLFSGGAGIYTDERGNPYRISCSTWLQHPQGPCLNCLGVTADLPPHYEEMVTAAKRSYIKGFGDHGPTPSSVVTLHAQCANLLVRHILYYLSDLSDQPVPLYLLWDEITLKLQDLTQLFPARKDCAVCGADGFWSYGDNAPRLPTKEELQAEFESEVT